MLFFLALLGFLLRSCNSKLVGTEFQGRNSFQYDNFDEDSLTYLKAETVYQCATFCSEGLRCEGFSFSRLNGTCVAFFDIMIGTLGLQTQPGHERKYFLQVFPSIYYYNTAETWEQAFQMCKHYGKTLAVLKSTELMDAAMTIIEEKLQDEGFDGIFIGMRMLTTSPLSYKWVDHTVVSNMSHLPWARNEPNYVGTDECIIIETKSLKLRTRKCNEMLPHFCTAQID